MTKVNNRLTSVFYHRDCCIGYIRPTTVNTNVGIQKSCHHAVCLSRGCCARSMNIKYLKQYQIE